MAEPGLLVQFYWRAEFMPRLSEKEGRPIFEDREFVSIIPLGDTKTDFHAEVTDEHRNRFPDEYAKFKRNAESQHVGTPVKEWPILRPSQIKMLEHLNIFTVEHLTEVNDLVRQRIGPGARELIEQAKAYIAKAKDSAVTQAYAAENDRLKTDIDGLRRQMAQMAALIPGAHPDPAFTGPAPVAAQAVPVAPNGLSDTPGVPRAAVPSLTATPPSQAVQPKRRGRPPKIKFGEPQAA